MPQAHTGSLRNQTHSGAQPVLPCHVAKDGLPTHKQSRAHSAGRSACTLSDSVCLPAGGHLDTSARDMSDEAGDVKTSGNQTFLKVLTVCFSRISNTEDSLLEKQMTGEISNSVIHFPGAVSPPRSAPTTSHWF